MNPGAQGPAFSKVPPHNIMAEEAILGGILINPEALPDVADILKPADFYREAHEHIFTAMLGLYEKGVEIDLITVCGELERKKILEKAGGPDYTAALAESVATSAGAAFHAGMVREASIRRNLICACQNISQKCTEKFIDTAELLDEAEQYIFDLALERSMQGIYPMNQVLKAGLKIIEGRGPDKISGLATGFTDLDRILTGLQKKELIILAARPSMGKTALALNIACHAAASGHGVAVFSLEMGMEQLGVRMIGAEARVDASRIRSGNLKGKEWDQIMDMANRVNNLPIFIDDSAILTLLDMRARIRRLERQQKIGLVIVDYLQLMSSNRLHEKREQQVSEISRGLKAIAKQFDVPVLALSQLNRKVEERKTRRPELADLRESGAIEQDADVILFIYRPEVYEPQRDDLKGQAEIIISKQRNGPTGIVKLAYLSHFTRFENFISEEDHDR